MATPQRKAYIHELNFIRFFAMVCVVLVHATSFVTVQLSVASRFYPVYNFLNIMGKCGTQVFIFLSAFVLFYNYYDRPLTKELIGRFYRQRLKFIFLPYLLFSLVYFTYTALGSGQPLDVLAKEFLVKLFTGTAWSHLYFVFVSTQFYLVFPLLLWALKRWPKATRYTFVMGLLLQWGFVLLNRYAIGFTNKGILAISYVAFYGLGIYAGTHYDRFKAFITGRFRWPLWLAWLGVGLAHVTVWQLTRVNGAAFSSLTHEFLWSTYGLLASVTFFGWALQMPEALSPRIVSFTSSIGIHSFGIYLFHPLVNIVYRHFQPTVAPLGYHLWVAGGFFASLLVSWAVVYLAFRYLPFAWVFFGSGPRQRRVAKAN